VLLEIRGRLAVVPRKLELAETETRHMPNLVRQGLPHQHCLALSSGVIVAFEIGAWYGSPARHRQAALRGWRNRDLAGLDPPSVPPPSGVFVGGKELATNWPPTAPNVAMSWTEP
jgi:hypothetical protein